MRNHLVVVANALSRQGWRFVHVMSMNGPVDLAVEAEYVPAEAGEVTRCVWEEKELGAWHLALSWGAREVVDLSLTPSPAPTGGEGKKRAVMWWIGERSQLEEGARASIREAVDLAGMLFRLRVGRAPVRALVGKKPAAAAAKVAVTGTGEVDLVEAGWVPGGFVVVE